MQFRLLYPILFLADLEGLGFYLERPVELERDSERPLYTFWLSPRERTCTASAIGEAETPIV